MFHEILALILLKTAHIMTKNFNQFTA